MYKKIILICFIFLLAGCTNINDNKDYVNLVKNCFTSKKVINDVSLGYKYYKHFLIICQCTSNSSQNDLARISS